jgi:hypothetical protein
LDTDQRASLLVLHVEPYLEWLDSGEGLEISRRRLKEITETLELLKVAYSSDLDRAREWLYSPEPNMRSRIPAAVLRVGKVGEVREQVEEM